EPPSPVQDLEGITIGLTGLRLSWTAPADDAPLGRAVRYDLRHNAQSTPDSFSTWTSVGLFDWPRPSGMRETLFVVAPTSGLVYYALRSTDAAGHWSALSNIVTVHPPSQPPDPVSDLRAEAVTESTVALLWFATGADGS